MQPSPLRYVTKYGEYVRHYYLVFRLDGRQEHQGRAIASDEATARDIAIACLHFVDNQRLHSASA
jgi:hypothetical protein